MNNDYLTQQQAAAVCGVPNSTFRYWRLKGRGPRYYQFGSHTFRWKREDIDAWLAENELHERYSN